MTVSVSTISSSAEPEDGAGLRPRDPRTNTMLAATIDMGGVRSDVFLRDVSSTGALMEGPNLPGTGEQLMLERGSIKVRAVVIWRQDRRCGINFERPVVVAEMMRRVGPGSSAQQARIDTIQRQIRTGASAHFPKEGKVEGRDVKIDLGYACRLVEALGDELTGDAYILSRYGPTLQKLDELMQLLKRVESQIDPAAGAR